MFSVLNVGMDVVLYDIIYVHHGLKYFHYNLDPSAMWL